MSEIGILARKRNLSLQKHVVSRFLHVTIIVVYNTLIYYVDIYIFNESVDNKVKFAGR